MKIKFLVAVLTIVTLMLNLFPVVAEMSTLDAHDAQMVLQTTSSDKFDLSNFGFRHVSSKGRGSLVFQSSPKGSFMKGFKYYDGDMIYVNLSFRQNGYALAYENGTYGYVDASYIDWGSSPKHTPAPRPSSDSRAKDLSQYDYRRVDSNGRGSLVFQEKPKGKAIKGFKYYDGDWIYVNVSWRKDGYAMAYEDGVFGYVDASYIDW